RRGPPDTGAGSAYHSDSCVIGHAWLLQIRGRIPAGRYLLQLTGQRLAELRAQDEALCGWGGTKPVLVSRGVLWIRVTRSGRYLARIGSLSRLPSGQWSTIARLRLSA